MRNYTYLFSKRIVSVKEIVCFSKVVCRLFERRFCQKCEVFHQFSSKLVLSLASANYHRISHMLADRVLTYVDFINSPQDETIQLK